jgi:hypothetical protein
VPWALSLDIAERLCSGDVQVTLVKDGDHRLSRDADIALLLGAVADLLGESACLMPLLLLVAATGATEADRSRYAACLALTRSDPARAIETAQAWRVENGGTGALHCLALAQFARRDYSAAFAAFDGAVKASQAAGDGQSIVLLGQAADAALAAEQPPTRAGLSRSGAGERLWPAGAVGRAPKPRCASPAPKRSSI